MAKILAIDLGEKRIGLAITDELEILVSGRGFIEREGSIEKILSLIEEEKVDKVVLGLPKLPSGGLGSQSKDVFLFETELAEKINIPIEFEDEVLTSVEAENRLRKMGKKVKDKGEIDEMAAIIILESYQRRS